MGHPVLRRLKCPGQHALQLATADLPRSPRPSSGLQPVHSALRRQSPTVGSDTPITVLRAPCAARTTIRVRIACSCAADGVLSTKPRVVFFLLVEHDKPPGGVPRSDGHGELD